MVIARHDRRVGRVGVGFYWGLLSFYVDATDALFMDRRARMLQAAAGASPTSVLCGIAALIALVLPDGHSRQLLLEFTALAYLSIVLQAVPLLELDDYWFLADVLDRPTLHADSTGELRHVLRREPGDRRLAVYAALSTFFGGASLAAGAAIWWHLFGHLFHQLWAGNLLYKILAGYLVLPFIALAFQLHRLRRVPEPGARRSENPLATAHPAHAATGRSDSLTVRARRCIRWRSRPGRSRGS